MYNIDHVWQKINKNNNNNNNKYIILIYKFCLYNMCINFSSKLNLIIKVMNSLLPRQT